MCLVKLAFDHIHVFHGNDSVKEKKTKNKNPKTGTRHLWYNKNFFDIEMLFHSLHPKMEFSFKLPPICFSAIKFDNNNILNVKKF